MMVESGYDRECGSSQRALLRSLFLIVFLAFAFGWIGAEGAAFGEPGPCRPYVLDSPWNLRIGPNPVYDPQSAQYVATLSGHFGVDPTQYTYPVYLVSEATPPQEVTLTGVFSAVSDGGQGLELIKRTVVTVPLPADAEPSRGRDGHVVLWNPRTGEEVGFWRVCRENGGWQAVNGYRYNTKWSGVPPVGFISRGAGLPYFAGLIRPWEIVEGRIEHALAVGIPDPSPLHVYPATKSDGKGGFDKLPEGARLQLDPRLTEKYFRKWGLDETGVIIARALQEYGMIVVDHSGHPKLYAEYEGTARWGGLLHKDAVRAIPYSSFRVLALEAPHRPASPEGLTAVVREGSVTLRWQHSEWATRYVVKRRLGTEPFETLNDWVVGTEYRDHLPGGTEAEYTVVAVSHNGISPDSEPVKMSQSRE